MQAMQVARMTADKPLQNPLGGGGGPQTKVNSCFYEVSSYEQQALDIWAFQ